MARKRGLLDNDSTATDSKKKRRTNDGTAPKRSARSKNFKAPNAVAAARGTQSAATQGKRTSTKAPAAVIPIPAQEPAGPNYERCVFIDDETRKPILALYRKTERAEQMSGFWTEFLHTVQHARDHINADVLMTFLSEEKLAAISLQNNSAVFPSLIQAKGALRSKDNLNASTKNAARIQSGSFGKSFATVINASFLRDRASTLRKKAQALKKQAEAYEKEADKIPKDKEDAPPREESSLEQHGMAYIGKVLSLSRKEFERYILDHEDHLLVTAEKHRHEMAGLAAFVHCAEVRFRDAIQLKVAADLKLCRDVKRFGSFELAVWQMEALPTEAHRCECESCVARQDSSIPPATKIKLEHEDDSMLPQIRRENALPEIQLEVKNDVPQATSMAPPPVGDKGQPENKGDELSVCPIYPSPICRNC